MSDNKVPMKFRVRDEQHSKEIQEKLFEMGFSWGGLYKITQYCSMPFLFAEDKFITYDVGPDSDYFDDHNDEEYVLLDGEFVASSLAPVVPAANVSEEAVHVSDKGAVKSDGGSSGYYALTITNKAGETIECQTGDVIAALVGDNFALGNVVKALRRIYECSQGRGKADVDMAYDVNKSKYFLDDFLGRYGK